MRNIMIKEVMTPISDYETIRQDQALFDAFQVLDTAGSKGQPGHRDLIVVDEDGNFTGKVTMLDIFRALEPRYKIMNRNYSGTLTKEFVTKAIKDFDLWLEPMKDLCERGAHIKISEIIHTPEDVECIQETDSLERALHIYVMEVHQPLIVKSEDKVTGVLRFEDLYKVIADHMLTCTL